MKFFTHILTVLTFTIFAPTQFIAQEIRKCGATENVQYQIENINGAKEKMAAAERQITSYLDASTIQTRTATKFSIPVVVHVIYNSSATNISDEQVQSQIDALNRDFNKNAPEISQTPSVFSSLVADCSIHFELAVRDENGKKTNGIVRHQTTRTEWGARDDVKTPAKGGFAPWNASKYLNIWVCTIGNSILGYAAGPGSPKEADGVVLDFSAFGTTGSARKPFNLGRTATHEIGHWLGLIHIWGDSQCGDDQVNDTPVQKDANYGSLNGMVYSNCSGKSEPNMSMNFMDYVNDASMWMFSEGQKNRMWAVLNTSRKDILKSDGLIAVVQSSCDQVRNSYIMNVTTDGVTIGWDSLKNINEYTLELKPKSDSMWTVSPTQLNTFSTSRLNSSSTYQFRIKGNCLVAPYSTVSEFTTKKDDFGRSPEVSVFPNPASSDFTVRMPQHDGEKVSIEVLDTNGRSVYKNEFINSSDPNVDMSGASAGLHFVVIKTANSTITQKIVKEN